MSPTCWLMKTSRPLVTATVFLRWAPTASSGGAGRPRATGEGAQPRARRSSRVSPASTKATLSSAWRAIGRSWTRKRSAMPPSRSTASRSSMQIGSSLRLPLVATTGKPSSAMSSACSGV